MTKLNRPRYDQISTAIKQVGNNSPSTEEAVLFVADTLSTVFDSATGGVLSTLNTAAQTLYSIAKANQEGGDAVIPNPWFVMNGHDDRANPRSARYFQGRAWKSIGSSAFSLAGTAASAHTVGINFADVVTNANALGSTTAHITKLIAIAADKRTSRSITVQDWLKVVLAMKTAKAGIRTGSLIGGLVPGASLPAGIATTVTKMGIRLSMNSACLTTAAAIHWRAFQEQQISGGLSLGKGGKIGPASRIFWEIFTRRGMTRMFGKYDIDALVHEPAGWLALHDKLMLL
ncbi:hypothetical protein [Acidocella sp.]|uniref:hypothetical protein n=1 Tax=Acidocella sp. TaxID=50710 RepID=UPI003D065331